MYCQQCGTNNEEGAKFCRSCGASLTVAPEPVKSGDNGLIKVLLVVLWIIMIVAIYFACGCIFYELMMNGDAEFGLGGGIPALLVIFLVYKGIKACRQQLKNSK